MSDQNPFESRITEFCGQSESDNQTEPGTLSDGQSIEDATEEAKSYGDKCKSIIAGIRIGGSPDIDIGILRRTTRQFAHPGRLGERIRTGNKPAEETVRPVVQRIGREVLPVGIRARCRHDQLAPDQNSGQV